MFIFLIVDDDVHCAMV